MKNVNEKLNQNEVNSTYLAKQKRAEKNQRRRERYHDQKLKRKSNENATSTSTGNTNNNKTKTNVAAKTKDFSTTKTKLDEKATSTNTNFEKKRTNVAVNNNENPNKWTKEKHKDYQRKWMAEQRAKKECLTSSTPNLEATEKSSEYQAAQKIIIWLEEIRSKEKSFPLKWLKKYLFQQSNEYWTAFKELLKDNRFQNRHYKKMCLPITLRTLQQWRDEKEEGVPRQLLTKKESAPTKNFLYDPLNNRLWQRSSSSRRKGKEILRKEITPWGKQRFLVTQDSSTNSYLYLEPNLERDWQLRVYGQERKDDAIHHYRAYFSTKDAKLVSISLQEWDEITKSSEGKWLKKHLTEKITLPGLENSSVSALSFTFTA